MIKLKDSLMLALGSINSAKLRSALTTLGIIIGVAAVVANVSLGASFNQYFTDELGEIGDNFIIIFSDERNLFGDSQLDVIKRTPGVVGVSPIKQQTAEVTFMSTSRQVNIQGTTQDYADVANIQLASGNYLSDKNQFVAVVGDEIANERFDRRINTRNSIDISLRRTDGTVVTQTFRVVGVIDSPDSEFVQSGAEPDTRIFIPISVMNQMLDETDYGGFSAKTATAEEVRTVSDEIDRNIARSVGVSARNIDDDDVKPYSIFNQADIVEQLDEVSNALTVLITSVALIALLVGSIGIMNIMLVTVTERTKEIGLMKSLGFTYTDLLSLFIVEAIIIGVIGGIFGTLLGLAGSFAVELYLDLPHLFPVTLIVAGFMISVVIGLIAGIYPANKAAKMNPVDALRQN
ncbi:ABC transporter permease [Methanosalsum natronophilum]|uniref:FtsX-like permease family protein n=1 Tax=Methanosalsum natronophilum TaxID=768733 RepID=A0A424Z4G1_9EURY|nr:ABC transporter permease [Methanosalsum natronophilum]MCS3924881.1 putative ABC transport system permease protein [Methanosalsum natronophilum]RQD91870.1 MAG: FtsX-like permease family protein [Methanosalsum natronophilum]